MSESTERQAELEETWEGNWEVPVDEDAAVLDAQMRESLTGVLTPPEESEQSPFDQAARTVTEQLAAAQLRLAELRAQRVAINAEVASLVAQEAALKRMARIVVRVEEADPT